MPLVLRFKDIFQSPAVDLHCFYSTGMSARLLESVRLPCNKSESKEWYNVTLMECILQVSSYLRSAIDLHVI